MIEISKPKEGPVPGPSIGPKEQQVEQSPRKERKISVPTTNGFVLVKVDEILRVEADRCYASIVLTTGKVLVACRNIKEFEERLNNACFFRAHRSVLINLLKVDRYVRGKGGHVVMTDGALIEISQRRKQNFILVIRSLFY